MIKKVQCILCTLLILISCSRESSSKKNNSINRVDEKKTVNDQISKSDIKTLSFEYLIGKWNLLLPDGGFSKNEFLLFENQGDKIRCKGVYQKFILGGEVLFNGGQVIMIDQKNGKFVINIVKSIEPKKNGAITLDLPNNEEDIQFGMYQKESVLTEE